MHSLGSSGSSKISISLQLALWVAELHLVIGADCALNLANVAGIVHFGH